jgi:hypothetical protein
MSPPKTRFLTSTTLERGLEKNPGRPRPKIGLRKSGSAEVLTWKHKKGVLGGDIEGALKTVDLEKIESRTY